MDDHTDRESGRVREAFRRRAQEGIDARYAPWEPTNLFIHQSRERALLAALRHASLLPLTGRKILDVGCGTASVLRDLLDFGAEAQDLHGVDLIPERVARAREVIPGARIELGDGRSLPYDDARFDLVLGFTLLSSVGDPDVRAGIAAEMVRVTRPGGLIVLYDYWTNPVNPEVSPIRRSEVRALFGGGRTAFRGVTLARPLVRALIGLPGGWLACTALEALPFLRTHYVAAVRA